MTQGDDNVAFYPEHLSEREIVEYFDSRFGITMTDFVRSNKEIHFCSQTMYTDPDGKTVCIPERPEKQFATFVMAASSPGRDEALESFVLNLRHHPQRETYIAAAQAVLSAAG
jgi:hypothetical protein